jgi:hypothetical protein
MADGKDEEKKEETKKEEKKVVYPKPQFELLLPKDGEKFNPFFHCVE